MAPQQQIVLTVRRALLQRYIANVLCVSLFSSVARIWFNERMRAELMAYVAAHKPKHKTQRLFYTQRSEGFTANTLTHIINSFYQKAGIANASSHSGRRSGLTALADKGVSVRVLMALAGHSQIATTQRYIYLRPSVVRAAVELV
jgi:integrase/recombinase XerD